MTLPNNAKFSVAVGMPTNSTGSDTIVTLRVEDRLSGEVLADIEFTPLQWVNLTRGTHTWIDGFRSSHLERVGKKMRTTSVMVPREATGWGSGKEEKQRAEEWFLANSTDALPKGWNGYETYRVQSSNQGWKVICHKWTEPTDAELKAEF